MSGNTSQLGLSLQKMIKEIHKPAKTRHDSAEHAEIKRDYACRDKQKSTEKSTN